MILNKTTDQNWLQSFSKMVSSLLTKLPIVVDVEFLSDRCRIVNRTSAEVQEYEFIYNFNKDPRTEVFSFRSWIVFNWCPKLVRENRFSRTPTPDEISEKLEQQKLDPSIDPYENVVDNSDEVFYIEKINPKKREVVLTTPDLEGDKIILKMGVPIYKFVKDYYLGTSVKGSSNYFFENSEELYTYYAKEHKK